MQIEETQTPVMKLNKGIIHIVVYTINLIKTHVTHTE